MPIIVNLDVMMAKRKIGLVDLAERINITPSNLSILKNNKAKAIRFSTLEDFSYLVLTEKSSLGILLFAVVQAILLFWGMFFLR